MMIRSTEDGTAPLRRLFHIYRATTQSTKKRKSIMFTILPHYIYIIVHCQFFFKGEMQFAI